MRLRKISIFCFLLLLSGFTFMPGHQAEAHYLSFITNSADAEVGKTHTVFLSYTHVLPTGAQFGTAVEVDLGEMGKLWMEDPSFDVKYLYNDDTSTTFPELDYGEKMDSSSAVLEKQGTVILSAACDITMKMGDPNGDSIAIPTHMFSKLILNAAIDGWSAQTLGHTLEIVPQSDLALVKASYTIKFKVLFNGNPLPNAEIEWAAPASELYEDPEEGGDANLQSLSNPTDAQGVFSYTVTHAGLNALGVTVEAEAMGEPQYAASLIFNAEEEDSDGGCNAGSGISCLIGLPIFLASLRKKRG